VVLVQAGTSDWGSCGGTANGTTNTAASMHAQAVANTLWAFANMNLELGGAQEPLMHAVVRVSDSMNVLAVANTLLAFAHMHLELGEAKEPLMRALVRV
jgi:hypothetical protein